MQVCIRVLGSECTRVPVVLLDYPCGGTRYSDFVARASYVQNPCELPPGIWDAPRGRQVARRQTPVQVTAYFVRG
jgi:hypothetical protein